VAFTDEPGIDLGSIMKVKMPKRPGNAGADRARKIDETAIAEAMRCGGARSLVSLANLSRLQSWPPASCAPTGSSGRCRPRSRSAREYREQLHNFLRGPPTPSRSWQEGIIVDANRACSNCSAIPATTRLTEPL